jgi:hypothetical protein
LDSFFKSSSSTYSGFPVSVSRFVIPFDHTERQTTVGRTPLDEGSARRRGLYLTTHNTHKRQTSMSPVGFEHTILASERPKTHPLDRTATGIGTFGYIIDMHVFHPSHFYNQLNLIQSPEDGASIFRRHIGTQL